MSLKQYVKKRDFKKTAEPTAGKIKDKDHLKFVVQKHAASHLHYDFRLEMEGVLKSWAVPKGPSTDPKVKRLAMMVEDHPYDYRTFEGIIPPGQYGGGTVMVWDEGTFEAAGLEDEDKKEQEKQLLHGLHSGKIKFLLHGKKLKGEFALVKAAGRGENGWLLMKLPDKFASEKDITEKDKSVMSDLSLEEIADTSRKIWNSNRPEKSDEKKKEKRKSEKIKPAESPKESSPDQGDINDLLGKAKKTKFPAVIEPMLATLVDKPFDDPDWVYEIKWDGYRAIAMVNKGVVELNSRNNKSFNEKFYPIAKALEKWEINAVVDGEIIVLNDHGLADFGNLQNWRSEADGELVYYVFDLLWYNGKNIMDLTLVQRQTILENILPVTDQIRLSTSSHSNGNDLFKEAGKIGLEGIIAKRASGMYTPGLRSKDWLKIKTDKRQEMIIAGYTNNENGSKKFSALLVGVYENSVLKYTGHVGTGFSGEAQNGILKRLKPLITNTCPFPTVPDYNKPSRFRPKPAKAAVTWVKPEIVCEVSYREITQDGIMRHAAFKGLREDKDAQEVVLEHAVNMPEVILENSLTQQKRIVAPKSKTRKTFLNPKDETQVRNIGGHDLKFTHLSKIYWPEDGVSKRDMLNYYYQVAPFILPYLKDRPQSLNRFPDGIHAPGFYQKNVNGKAPEWVKTFPYKSMGEDKEFMVGTDEASLLYMASLGCIEMNPWFSRVESPDHPDYCVIDLDPDKNTFDQVIEAALEVRKVLEEIKIPSYAKTSGSTGMHIYIPLAAKYTYDQSQLFAKLIVSIVHSRLPDYTSLERMVAKRNGKMYLDFLQNRPGATIACPYSLRPKPGAIVSMPLHWEEVKPGLKMKDFTIFNAMERLNATGDIFKHVLGKGIDLEKTIRKAQDLFRL